MSNELEAKIWAIITEKDIITTNKTYSQCVTLISKCPSSAYIVTNLVAHRMFQTIVNRHKLNDFKTNSKP